ncbi:MAG: efflux RND transporter periplasmic adaptor subunit [Crocinitomicaceae bacterium]|nr:efflux RND transporter periplasmic adaptor subunit [Crocinitomicaceae bacterium]
MKKTSLVVCLATILLVVGCKPAEHQEKESKLVVTNPIQKDTVIYKNYVCVINSIQHIELRALEKGYLQNIYVDEGQYIKKGQLMFKILPSIYDAEAQVAKAQKDFEEIEYQTTKKLADKNIVSPNELAMSKAKLEKAKAELQLANTHLGFTDVKAPFDGYMGKFEVRLGSLLDEGELLTTLSDNRKIWVYFNVPEAEYLNFKQQGGQLPKVKLLMANNDYFDKEGVIETIEADFNSETGNIAFRATFDNDKGLLRHGETGSILMPVDLKNAVIIPQEATFEVLDKKFVYVVDKNNVIHTREIQIAAELPQLYVVSKGLSTKDKVLLEGLRLVKNNDKISYTFKSTEAALKEMNSLFSE